MKIKNWIVWALFLVAAVCFFPGCTTAERRADGSWHYHNRLFWKSAAVIQVEGGTNHYKLRIEGYKSEADKLVDAFNQGVALGKKAAGVP